MPPLIWIFAYGSLMWKPGFEFAAKCQASLNGAKRSLCVKAMVHRGTPELPGLVLGLETSESDVCIGYAFQIPEEKSQEILESVRKRELIRDVYVEKSVTVQLSDGREVEALAYFINPECKEYDKQMTDDEKAHSVAHAEGISGTCFDYVQNTLSELEKMGISDPELTRLFELAVQKRL